MWILFYSENCQFIPIPCEGQTRILCMKHFIQSHSYQVFFPRGPTRLRYLIYPELALYCFLSKEAMPSWISLNFTNHRLQRLFESSGHLSVTSLTSTVSPSKDFARVPLLFQSWICVVQYGPCAPRLERRGASPGRGRSRGWVRGWIPMKWTNSIRLRLRALQEFPSGLQLEKIGPLGLPCRTSVELAGPPREGGEWSQHSGRWSQDEEISSDPEPAFALWILPWPFKLCESINSCLAYASPTRFI